MNLCELKYDTMHSGKIYQIMKDSATRSRGTSWERACNETCCSISHYVIPTVNRDCSKQVVANKLHILREENTPTCFGFCL